MTTLNLQVAASTDDCMEILSSGWFDITANEFYAGHYNATDYKWGSGARFQNVTIPHGATIDSAYFILTCKTSRSGTVCNTEISADDTDNAATFSTKANFESRYAARTTAQINWDGLGAWTAETEYTSPDIKNVIQEVIDRAGWSSGNALVLFWEDFDNESTGSGLREAYAYDGGSSKAPKLQIIYSTGEAKTSADSGSGTESIYARELVAAEAGSGLEASLTAAALVTGDAGSGSDIGGLLQSLFAQDAGDGVDSVRILTGKAGRDLRLQTHQGKVHITHKEVNL
jgi:hypothetical protein